MYDNLIYCMNNGKELKGIDAYKKYSIINGQQKELINKVNEVIKGIIEYSVYRECGDIFEEFVENNQTLESLTIELEMLIRELNRSGF